MNKRDLDTNMMDLDKNKCLLGMDKNNHLLVYNTLQGLCNILTDSWLLGLDRSKKGKGRSKFHPELDKNK